jgi:Holliday junction resolvase
MARGDQRRGIQRERDLAAQLGEDGWWVARAAGSKGEADLVCLKAGRRPMMLEVKSTTAGPFAGFGPEKRAALIRAAAQSGARPFLVWWPKHRKPAWLAPTEWPPIR